MPRRLVLGLALVLVPALGCSKSGGSQSSFCSSVRGGENPSDVFDRYDPRDVSAAHDTLQQGLLRLKQLESAAPSDLKPSVTTLVRVAQKLITSLDERATNPSSTATPDFSSDYESATQASARITQFAADQCGIQLDPNATTTTTAAPPPSS